MKCAKKKSKTQGFGKNSRRNKKNESIIAEVNILSARI